MATPDEERARIQEIADKYRVGVSDESKRAILVDFILFLAKENVVLADEHDLITMRGAFEWIEGYLKEKQQND